MANALTIEKVLEELRPEFDFATSQDFIGDGMLDSYDLMMLVSKLDEVYKISIAGTDILPEHFRNVATILELLKRYIARP